LCTVIAISHPTPSTTMICNMPARVALLQNFGNADISASVPKFGLRCRTLDTKRHGVIKTIHGFNGTFSTIRLFRTLSTENYQHYRHCSAHQS